MGFDSTKHHNCLVSKLKCLVWVGHPPSSALPVELASLSGRSQPSRVGARPSLSEQAAKKTLTCDCHHAALCCSKRGLRTSQDGCARGRVRRTIAGASTSARICLERSRQSKPSAPEAPRWKDRRSARQYRGRPTISCLSLVASSHVLT